MSAFKIIIFVIGMVLLSLGTASGVALFRNALKTPDRIGADIGLGTLWGLFVTGLLFGLVLTAWALPS